MGMNMEIQVKERVHQQSAGLSAWFTVFNPFYSESDQMRRYPLQPFPVGEFPPESPWEDSIIVDWYGVEPYAAEAGFSDVGQYLKAMIQASAMTGIVLR